MSNLEVTLGLAEPFTHGRVQPQASYVTTPAAGAGFTINVGGNYWERPVSLSFLLTSDSNAANRQVILKLTDGQGLTVAAIPAGSVQAASLGYQYTFMRGQTSELAVAGLNLLAPIFPHIVRSGWSISLAIVNVQVGDAITNIVWYRDRFSTGPDGYPIGAHNLSRVDGFIGSETALTS